MANIFVASFLLPTDPTLEVDARMQIAKWLSTYQTYLE